MRQVQCAWKQPALKGLLFNAQSSPAADERVVPHRFRRSSPAIPGSTLPVSATTTLSA
jgi:hypothetical protein